MFCSPSRVFTLAVVAVGGGSPYYSSCGSATGPASLPIAAGVYSLGHVNTAHLPYLVSETGAGKVEIVSGSATLTTSYTWSRSTTLRHVLNGDTTIQTLNGAGTASFNGTTLFLYDSTLTVVARVTQSYNALTLMPQDSTTTYGYIKN